MMDLPYLNLFCRWNPFCSPEPTSLLVPITLLALLGFNPLFLAVNGLLSTLKLVLVVNRFRYSASPALVIDLDFLYDYIAVKELARCNSPLQPPILIEFPPFDLPI